MKILITGATGFVGANLARLLVTQKANVHILLRESSNTWRISDILDKLNKHYCDLFDRENTKRIISEVQPNVILHLAVYGGYPFQNDSQQMINTNFIGTVNLIDACTEEGFGCFINAGSSSEYGIKEKPMNESDLLEPINIYGATKAAATLYCQVLAKKYDLPIFTLRLFSPYGYYEEPTRLIPYLIISMLKNEKIKIASPNVGRDFIFIDDVVDAFLQTINTKDKILPGTILNVGSGSDAKVVEVFETLREITGYRGEFTVEGTPRDSDKLQVWRANTEKIQKMLRWRPKYNLKEGLIETVKWFRENIHLYKGERRDG